MIILTYLLFQHVLFIQHFVKRIIYVDTHGRGRVFSLQYSVTLYEQFIHYPVVSVTLYEQFIHYPVVGHLSCFHFSVVTNHPSGNIYYRYLLICVFLFCDIWK